MNRPPPQKGASQASSAPPLPARGTPQARASANPIASPNPSPTTEGRFRTLADQDDRLWQIIDGFLARLKESPPLREITPAQLNAILNHTQGNGWKGMYAFVKGQLDKDKRNRDTAENENKEKEGRRREPLEGRHEKFWQQIQKTLEGEIKELRAGLSEERDRALARIFATMLVAKTRMELLLNPSLYYADRETSWGKEGR